MSGYLDRVARIIQNFAEPTPKTTSGDALQWVKKVFNVTWVEQPQNVYNLIAFAAALIIIFVSIKYGKDHIK